MRITGTGHASMRIDTPAGSILCDPWVNPAYFASWFPFPDNSALDWDALGDCDYLYVSHLHRDHFDAEHLRRFGSGYDRGQVDRLFDNLVGALSGRSPVTPSDGELDPAQFDLVPGGYFEAEVDAALKEVRDLLGRRR